MERVGDTVDVKTICTELIMVILSGYFLVYKLKELYTLNRHRHIISNISKCSKKLCSFVPNCTKFMYQIVFLFVLFEGQAKQCSGSIHDFVLGNFFFMFFGESYSPEDQIEGF